VRKLGQNLARGGGGAGHGFLSTMAESLREREREIVEFDEMDKEPATVCVSQFVLPTVYFYLFVSRLILPRQLFVLTRH